jgi:hypothetical protein
MVVFKKSEVVGYAEFHGWTTVGVYNTSQVICFVRGNQRISVYYVTGTVATCTDRSIQGKTEAFHKNIKQWKTLCDFFHDVETKAGGKIYYRRRTGKFGEPEPILKGRFWMASPTVAKDLRKMDADSTVVVALGKTTFHCNARGKYLGGGSQLMPKALSRHFRGRQPWLPQV